MSAAGNRQTPRCPRSFQARTSAAFGGRLHHGFADERRKACRCRIHDQELNSEPLPCLINSAGSSTYLARKSVRTTRATADVRHHLAQEAKRFDEGLSCKGAVFGEGKDGHRFACRFDFKPCLPVGAHNGSASFIAENPDTRRRDSSGDFNQRVMLVSNIQIMECSKRRITPVIGPQFPYEILNRSWRTMDLPRMHGFFDILRAFGEGKGCTVTTASTTPDCLYSR